MKQVLSIVLLLISITAFADTIEVRGKYLTGCDFPKSIKLRPYNPMTNMTTEVAVNEKGEFTYRYIGVAPKQITVRSGKTNYDFLVTAAERILKLEISCTASGHTIAAKDSRENNAFQEYDKASKTFQKDFEVFCSSDLSNNETFARLQKLLSDYNKTLQKIITTHPNSFTAKTLCVAAKLPDEALTSLDALRQQYLNRDAFGNPTLYDVAFSSRTLQNYLFCIRNPDDQTFTWFEKLMATGLKNTGAARMLQQVIFDVMYFKHEEDLLIKYASWSETNGAKMYNSSVKMRLKKLSACMAGSPIIDIDLKDQSGVTKKLSEIAGSGKLTVLIFYSPNCAHCKQEMPQFNKMWEQYKDKGLRIYSVAFDAQQSEWQGFIKSNLKDWTHVFEPSDIRSPYTSQYVVNYTPTYLLIDQNGNIISRFGKFDYIMQEIPKRLG